MYYCDISVYGDDYLEFMFTRKYKVDFYYDSDKDCFCYIFYKDELFNTVLDDGEQYTTNGYKIIEYLKESSIKWVEVLIEDDRKHIHKVIYRFLFQNADDVTLFKLKFG